MKNKRKHRIPAAVLSGVLLVSAAFSQVPAVISAETVNLISNSTFDSGTSGWGIYKESGGAAVLSTDSGRLALQVTSIGKLSYSVQMYYDIIPLYKNGVYHLSYEISSDTDRYVEGMIQQNGGTYQAYTWKGLNLTAEPQVVDYEFTMTADTDIMAKMVFNCGNEGDDLDAHTIYLDNVVLELVDDSAVDYSEIRAYEPPIVINQVGYCPDDEKIAVFREITDENTFTVVNADTGTAAYTGELYGEKINSSADETDWFGDFSAVTEPGSYYITCGSLDDSYIFTIGENVYSDLLNDAVRMLYLQRCGTEIEDETFSHPACHSTMARVYGTTDEYIDVSGGWHDAGDYGRYTVPAAKTVADMLYAYQANPSMFSDSVGIPESGNGVPDILDEARYALEWMLKMQDPETGGVHHKVTCENFPGYIMPQFETGELIVTPVSTTATGDFCGAMALAWEFFTDIDADFADTCLAAAEKAWGFLEENPSMIYSNPSDITTGDYGDTSDRDERWWAAAQLYRATGKTVYENALYGVTISTGLEWTTVGDYGNIALLTMNGIDKNSELYKDVLNSFTNRAVSYAATSEASPYGVSITRFNWGSNMTVGNAGVLLGMTAKLTGEERYLKAAKSNLNYLLGKNPNGVCFVTGYGTVSPQNPHHRPSMAMKTAMKGMLVGGVNSNKEDSAAKAYLVGMPSAKCYVDHSESYSTNEITTYWNSPLIYLLALTQEENSNTVAGDVNTDGSVTIADAVLLQKYLLNEATLTKTQWKNADMTGDSRVSGTDLTALRQALLLDTSKQVLYTFPASEENVRISGRMLEDDGYLWTDLSGSFVEFTAAGSRIDLTLASDFTVKIERYQPRIAVLVNGEVVLDTLLSERNSTFTIWESAREQTVQVRVIKLSESNSGAVGIGPIQISSSAGTAAGRISPTTEKPFRIQFLGDSITCGYGVEAASQSESFSTATENFMKTYAFLTAQALDAEYQAIAYSGYGVYTGYSADGSRNEDATIQNTYDRYAKFTYQQDSIHDLMYNAQWNHADYQPDVVVINLGTNDEAYLKNHADECDDFTESYTALLEMVRQRNPEAYILCTLSDGSTAYSCEQQAVKTYTAQSGDNRISIFRLPSVALIGDFGADWHPGEQAQKQMAESLTAEIQSILIP